MSGFLPVVIPMSLGIGYILYEYGVDMGLSEVWSKILMGFVNCLIGFLVSSLILFIVDHRTTDKVRVVKGYEIYSSDTTSDTFVLRTRTNTSSDSDKGKTEYFFYRKKNGSFVFLTTLAEETIIRQSTTGKAHLDIAFQVDVSRFGIIPPSTQIVSYYIIYLPKKYVIR